MYIKKDNFLIRVHNDLFDLFMLSSLGDRADQQDSAGYDIGELKGTVLICDGMGGHRDGKLASRLATEAFLEKIKTVKPGFINKDMIEYVQDIDEDIADLKDDAGNPLMAGTTLAAVHIENDELYWVSVGDSRIYILRKAEFIQVTEDHTYELALKENIDAGEITEQFFKEEIDKSDALISFLGAGELPIISSNETAFRLQTGDRIVIMSDGLYKNLDDQRIKTVICDNDPANALSLLDFESAKNAHKKQKYRDNLTIALLSIR